MTTNVEPPEVRPDEFHIQIDRVHFTVNQRKLTGAQLRALPTPPIGSDRDLYEIRPGDQDRLIGDAEEVAIRDGLRFFTAPKHINPGIQ